MKILSQLFLGTLMLILPLSLMADTLPAEAYVPGGIAIISTGVKSDKQKPQIKFANRKVASVVRNGEWHAVVGIPLKQNPGQHASILSRKKL